MAGFAARRAVLLTGAGFTKNFGGFLAAEMWARVLNNPAVGECDPLRRLLLDTHDYEVAYSRVVGSEDFSNKEQTAMADAVTLAYRQLDDATREWVFKANGPYPVNVYKLQEILTRFSGSGETKGFFFTLNQDLFLERYLNYRCPGAPTFPGEIYTRQSRELRQEDWAMLPDDMVVGQTRQDLRHLPDLLYVKLHGSYGWRSSTGSSRLVIGRNKPDLIAQEPLLRWYFELFQDVLWSGGKTVFIIGYGFGDEHVNRLLLKAVAAHGATLRIINPEPFSLLRGRITTHHHYALPMLDGLRGYYPHLLREIFPGDQSDTVYFKELRHVLMSLE